MYSQIMIFTESKRFINKWLKVNNVSHQYTETTIVYAIKGEDKNE